MFHTSVNKPSNQELTPEMLRFGILPHPQGTRESTRWILPVQVAKSRIPRVMAVPTYREPENESSRMMIWPAEHGGSMAEKHGKNMKNLEILDGFWGMTECKPLMFKDARF